MKNKTSFRSLLVLATACSAVTTLGCFKTDSIGSASGEDGGTDSVGKDAYSCPPANVVYTAPGCGTSAVPICLDPQILCPSAVGICREFPPDACPVAEYYCGCDGVTTMQSRCSASPSPFLYAGACQTTPDASQAPDAPPFTTCDYPTESVLSDAGEELWWWRFNWTSASPDLATMCAAWGADAKMILEVMVPASTTGTGTTLPICTSEAISSGAGPACSVANTRRFEAACTEGHFLLQLPSENTFNAFYHVESTNYPNSTRHIAFQAVEGCVRDTSAIPGGPPSTGSDGGVDAAASGSDGGTVDVQTAADLGGDGVADPCAACTANQVCTQLFDGTCRLGTVVCKTVSDTCRTKLSASSAKSCSAFPECESEFCASPFRCVYATPCGTEAPQAAVYCYGP